MSKPILAGCVWLPERRNELAELRSRFTIDYYRLAEDVTEPIHGYVESDGYLGVPRQAGLQLISKSGFVDLRSDGWAVKFATKPKLRSYQEPFFKDMLAAAQGAYPDFLASAATGKGKTVVSLAVAAELERTTIVLVDQEKLRDQWVDMAVQHLGADVDRDIGFVQGSKCQFEGKKLVIGMVQSLSQRDYPEEFYEYFGLAVFDEAHIAGAPVMSRVLMQFPARVRFGVSATVKRGDALDTLIKWNLGVVEAKMDSEHLPSRVYYAKTDAVVSWYSNKAKVSGRYLTELSEDPCRNLLIYKAIRWLYDSGRDTLIIGDRIEQLCNLMALCSAYGIPDADMGIYARYRNVWVYEKNPKPVRRPHGWEKSTDYTPVRLAYSTIRVKPDELARTMEKAKLVFATYKMFSKGVDLPRLAGGVDATPNSKAIQSHGRILRTSPDKKLPIWITFRDVWSFRAEHQFLQRLTDYVASNAEVYLWDPDKGIKKQDVAALSAEVQERVRFLKGQRIITRQDGSFTVITPTTPNVSAVPQGMRTGARTRYPLAG